MQYRPYFKKIKNASAFYNSASPASILSVIKLIYEIIYSLFLSVFFAKYPTLLLLYKGIVCLQLSLIKSHPIITIKFDNLLLITERKKKRCFQFAVI